MVVINVIYCILVTYVIYSHFSHERRKDIQTHDLKKVFLYAPKFIGDKKLVSLALILYIGNTIESLMT